MIKTEKQQRKELATIANFRDKNEKASWLRKKKNLEAIVLQMEPLEEQLIKLNYEKLTLLDEIEKIRVDMVADCIHPQDYLVHLNDVVLCKFCNTRIALMNV